MTRGIALFAYWVWWLQGFASVKLPFPSEFRQRWPVARSRRPMVLWGHNSHSQDHPLQKQNWQYETPLLPPIICCTTRLKVTYVIWNIMFRAKFYDFCTQEWLRCPTNPFILLRHEKYNIKSIKKVIDNSWAVFRYQTRDLYNTYDTITDVALWTVEADPRRLGQLRSSMPNQSTS